MRGRTLTNLIADVRRVADLDGMTARHPDANITRELNQSIQAFRRMVTGWCDYYVLNNVAALTVAAGSDRVSGADLTAMVRLYGLDIQIGNEWRELFPYSIAERNRYQADTAGTGIPTYYREYLGTTTTSFDIKVIPTADATYTMRSWHLTAGVDLSLGADVFDGISGWEDWIIYDTAIRCATRDSGVNDNYELLTQELGRIQARIEKEARTLKLPGTAKRLDTRGRRMAVEQSNRVRWLP